MSAKKIAPEAHELRFQETLRGHALTFTTTWGLFQPRGVDAGTALLIDRIQVPPGAVCLDLGCGWGPIGVTLARLAPEGEVHLVDKDFVAVEYASRNARANRCDNARVYLSNGFSHVPEETNFDVIASNLPAKAGGELLSHWLRESHRRLRLGGQLWVVTIAGLKDYVKREFREQFGNYRKVKQIHTHVVAVATRQ